MGTFLKRIGTGLKTVCGCVSVAMEQARQSEIDVLSRRSFRERNGLGDPSPTHLRETGLGSKELMTRLGIGLRTFQSCCSEANRNAEKSEIDVSARRIFHELQGAGPEGGEESGPILEKKVASKEVPRETPLEGIEPSLVEAG
jgi:hypothetical protein